MKQQSQKDLLYILIPSFVLVLAWIGFTIYSNAISSTITEAQQVNIQPIAPNFDTATVEALKARKKVASQNEAIMTQEEEPSVNPTPELPNEQESPSAQEQPTLEEEAL